MPLSWRQQKALDALMVCETKASAAAMANVTTVTLWRWQQNEEFQKAYEARLHASKREAVALAQRKYLHVVLTWLDILDDPTAPHASRTRAGELVINFGQKAGELQELANRVEQLEGHDVHDDSCVS